MKKLVGSMLLLLMLFNMTACSIPFCLHRDSNKDDLCDKCNTCMNGCEEFILYESENPYLLPLALTAEDFHEVFLYPFVQEVYRQWRLDFNEDKMESEYNNVHYQFAKNEGSVNEDGTYKHLFVLKYIGSVLQKFSNFELNNRTNMMYQLLQCYSLNEDGIYILSPDLSDAEKCNMAWFVQTLCPSYDYDTMYSHEKAAFEKIPTDLCKSCELRLNVHSDFNGDYICDICEIALSICMQHSDADKNGVCDVCKAILFCNPHLDKNHNQKCDWCDEEVSCKHFLDGNGLCLWCDHTLSE